jgi:proline iminopeptidase
MYPPIKPFNSFFLKTEDKLHSIYVEECGNKNGIPIVYLHGGPGGSIDSKNRRYFNPKKYRIILFDQRGSGRSKPKGSLKKNTTNNLIDDMEKIRNILQVKKWIIYGGSWGSTLALIYAIRNNSKVLAMVLRGVFLGNKDEAYWAFHYSSKYFYPEIIDAIENKLKEKNKKIFLKLGKMLESKKKNIKTISSIIWEKYERTLSVLNPGKINLKKIKKIKKKKLPNSPFLEWHYTKNNFFLKKNEIISNIKTIKNIPTIIIQGRYDLICPPKSAFLLAKNMSNCDLKIIENSGHSASEPNIKINILKAIDKISYKIKEK